MFEAFIFVAALVEQVVELTFGRFLGKGKQFPGLAWLLPLITGLLGVVACFAFQVGVVAALFATLGGAPVTVNPYVDYVVSGILIMAGADAVHALRKKYLPGGAR